MNSLQLKPRRKEELVFVFQTWTSDQTSSCPGRMAPCNISAIILVSDFELFSAWKVTFWISVKLEPFIFLLDLLSISAQMVRGSPGTQPILSRWTEAERGPLLQQRHPKCLWSLLDNAFLLNGSWFRSRMLTTKNGISKSKVLLSLPAEMDALTEYLKKTISSILLSSTRQPLT